MELYELLRPSMRMRHAGLLAQSLAMPQPSGPPRHTDADADAAATAAVDRVLLIGNGPLHGWGVLSHDLSAVGHLSRLLTNTSKRRTVVDYVGEERMNTATSLEWLGDRASRGYDLAVVVLSMNDALRLTPVARFAQHYEQLVRRILDDLDPRAELLLMTLPDVGRYANVRGWAGAVARHHATRLSDVVRRVGAGSDRVTVVEPPVEHFVAGRPHGSTEFYADWATQATASISPMLERVRRIKPAAAARQVERSALVEAATATPDAALVAISERAKEHFGVAIAGVSLADGDRIAVAAQTGGAPASMPRSLMYCGSVFATDAPVVITDRSLDPRYRDSELIDLLGAPFYTGVPLHASDGTVVGAFCVLDSATHDTDFVPISELAVFAEQAQTELSRIEAETALQSAGRGPR